MSLMDLLKRGSLTSRATAIPATFATDTPLALSKVAKVATVAVANTQSHAANEPAPDSDRWCWPHSEAMTGREIDIFTVRLVSFTGKGIKKVDAESLAHKLVIRDREFDDRAPCLECAHLSCFGHSDWYCENWQVAGVAIRARDAHLPADLVVQLQRCEGFDQLQRTTP